MGERRGAEAAAIFEEGEGAVQRDEVGREDLLAAAVQRIDLLEIIPDLVEGSVRDSP